MLSAVASAASVVVLPKELLLRVHIVHHPAHGSERIETDQATALIKFKTSAENPFLLLVSQTPVP